MNDIVEQVCGERVWDVPLGTEKPNCSWEVVLVGSVVSCHEAAGFLQS